MKELKREQFFATNSKGEVVLDAILRYGNKLQADKAIVSNSLFGGSETVEIAKPEIPKAEEWSTLERLTKERDVIGIYLSAHPLDEYFVELNYLCNTPLADIKDIEQIKKKKVIKTGGIVTACRTGMTKKGNQFGAITIEDFSGANEFMLFGDDFVEYSKYQKKDLYVYVQGIVEARRNKWDKGDNPNAVEEFKIKKMGLLHELANTPVERVTLSVDVNALDEDFVKQITEITANNHGTTQLYFKMMDTENNLSVDMFARGAQVKVSKEFILFLQKKQEETKLINFAVSVS
jgi:DNA polymerase-3 subunit alpha